MKAACRSGSETNSLRSNMFHFFIRPTHYFHGSVSSGISKKQTTVVLPLHSESRVVLVLPLLLTFNPWRSAAKAWMQVDKEAKHV
jgi:hypothetical protein